MELLVHLVAEGAEIARRGEARQLAVGIGIGRTQGALIACVGMPFGRNECILHLAKVCCVSVPVRGTQEPFAKNPYTSVRTRPFPGCPVYGPLVMGDREIYFARKMEDQPTTSSRCTAIVSDFSLSRESMQSSLFIRIPT
ncbi:hypothetical protein ACN9MB_21005 [Dyella kyungheensis]|jgi:hypothetical protein|uniref:hypothetical protein n=1 Tax=Dyella kyungheensis TaxID=1242174 RepID=UPI003CEAB750